MTRRFFQFGLATMLVLVAVICVVLAIRSNRQHNRRVAIAKIEELGGEIKYLSELSTLSSTAWDLPAIGRLARLFGDDPSTYVILVVLNDAKVTDADLANLLTFSELQGLVIGNDSVTDAGLLSLGSLPNLKLIQFLDNACVTKTGVDEFHKALPNCKVMNKSKVL